MKGQRVDQNKRVQIKPLIIAGFVAIVFAAGGMSLASYNTSEKAKVTAENAQTLAKDKANSSICQDNPKEPLCAKAQQIVTDAKAGPQGIMGLQGPPGPEGPQGPRGLMGLIGASGSPGLAGSMGQAGSNGANGLTGAQGLQGSNGLQGPMGPQGLPGVDGKTGATGAPGKDSTVPGPQGPVGPQGSQGPPPASWTWTEPGAVGALNKTHTCTRSGGPDSAPTYACN